MLAVPPSASTAGHRLGVWPIGTFVDHEYCLIQWYRQVPLAHFRPPAPPPESACAHSKLDVCARGEGDRVAGDWSMCRLCHCVLASGISGFCGLYGESPVQRGETIDSAKDKIDCNDESYVLTDEDVGTQIFVEAYPFDGNSIEERLPTEYLDGHPSKRRFCARRAGCWSGGGGGWMRV